MPARYMPPEEWNAIVAAQQPQIVAPRPLEPNPEAAFIERMSTGHHPWGLFAPTPPMINGQFPGASSPAAWHPTMGWASGGPAVDPLLPQDAAAAKADLPQAPTPEEARRNQGPAPAGGWPTVQPMGARVSSAMGQEFMPDHTDADIAALKKYLLATPKVGDIPKPSPELLNKGLGYSIDADDKRAAAIKAESLIEAEQQKALSDVEGEKQTKRNAWATEDENAVGHMGDYIAEQRKNADADSKWLRENQRVDPYRTFRTNAGAGIMAALGGALMATGAAMRRDNTLDWTKQIDKMLDREADIQIREIQNHRGTLNDAQTNIKRILESSRDMDEAKMRFRNQQLEGLNSKIEAIKHSTESKAVVERANALIAANKEQMGKNIMDVAARLMGLESQENISKLMAGVTQRGQDTALEAALAHISAGEREKVMQILSMRTAPMQAAQLKLDELASRAKTTGKALFDAVRQGSKYTGVAKNTLAESFTGALKSLLEGTDRAGDRPEVAAYSWTLDPRELMKKLDRYDPETIGELMTMIEALHGDRSRAIWSGTLGGDIPTGSKFSKPAPK